MITKPADCSFSLERFISENQTFFSTLRSSSNYKKDLFQDGTDCPRDVMEGAVADIGGLVRPPMNQEQFDEKFSYHRPHEPSEEVPRRLMKLAKK